MLNSKSTLAFAAAAAVFVPMFLSSQAKASVDWDAFVIRNGGDAAHTAPTITKQGDNGVTATISIAGQKAGFGTASFDGQTLSTLQSISYTRDDAGTKFPYLNIWITDGTNHALIAPVIGGTTNGGYDSSTAVNGQNLQTLGFNLYDNSAANYDWLVPGAKRADGPNSMLHADGTILTLADIGSLIIQQMPGPIADGGAPAFGDGVNLVFGDTQGNFVDPVPYQLSNITAVPEPTVLGGIAMVGGLFLRRRRKATV